MTTFRFSFNVFAVESLKSFIATCQHAEKCGYDTVFAADHLGMPSPFPTLVAAAAATERLRVGTLVLNTGFWNPALLARDIATTDVLTNGRLEVGLGSGHMKWEYDEANIAFDVFAARARRLRETIDELTRQFSLDGYPQQTEMRAAYHIPALRPIQRRGFNGYGPPLIIGGTGNRMLQLAAECADVVSVAGIYQIHGQAPGTMRLATPAEIDDRISYVRKCAGDRADQLEWHTLVQAVVPTDDRHGAAEKIARQHGNRMTAEEILQLPQIYLGTVTQMAQHLRDSRDRYGFTHYTIQQPNLDSFAPVIARTSARA
ncbi:TIGR03621 family F420-dependent LLM class oxidoreductase [Mycobacterium haemophilum]|uniref:5,10-methylene tetrahydromethanopterin reductase n=1 Tax=Mycobacterium haemophilum TaxID=29311 RepID=A0A0I9V4J2_9MYCO|nr:TIGR03621 family F420-dependent LLM class oxidoreductase [Mycobacterium haemophilum]KLO33670.1 5,10-methylene tetrahydromethanopterin reductase [Mycobacterium haemophilum]KLO39197.1 5,10-methylene tetrahydromethanopterin reductase [Mycobacterium haemophilum]KLO41785.1 5,10-methylene tetrahydromethanopterin reductase [Mycobacterium haemophilum]KLO49815.1 5,10-methylene tetrahydromethanopterin reductase [Mycobacterium haemophilum]